MILLICSGFLLYRISVLEAKLLYTPMEPEKIIMWVLGSLIVCESYPGMVKTFL